MTRLALSDLEASRPDFHTGAVPYVSKAPDTAWIPGQGLNGLPYAADFHPDRATWRTIDPNEHERRQVYKLLISGVAPRPVALVSTVSTSGSRNLAPMSNFNMVSSNPPTVMISVESGSTKNPSGLKDTNQNIRDTSEFCISIISETFVEAAHITAIDAPAGVSEWELSGLTPRLSQTVAPPHVAESAYSMECKVMHWYTITGRQGEPSNTVILGEVTRFHVKEFVLEKDDPMRVSTEKLRPIARLGGLSYSRTNQIFDLATPVWANFKGAQQQETTFDAAASTLR